MKLATWNVNSIRQRQTHVAGWLEANAPDLLLLQEIKCEAHAFPADAFRALGYESTVVGQKAYNGVAILSRLPVTVTARHLPGLALPEAGEHQARYVEIRAADLTVGNLYLPNGNSGGADGYAAKLAWMDALIAHARSLLADDAVRALVPRGPVYTFWDYQAGCWPRDLGLRIDHALLSPRLAERLAAAAPDRAERDRPQPSHHVPLVVELA